MITTYNRNGCIYELTKALKSLYPCHIVVVDDGSDVRPNRKYIDTYYRFNKNNGKEGWFIVVNKLWRIARRTKADYYIQTVDDALPNENFFTDAIRLFESIDDSDKVAMHLANNGRAKNWTNFDRTDYSEDVYLTQTTETSFISKAYFITLSIRVNQARWDTNKNLGSGVFAKLCLHWVSKGKNIYGVKTSLLRANPDCDISKMNTEARIKSPWKLI